MLNKSSQILGIPIHIPIIHDVYTCAVIAYTNLGLLAHLSG